jgi:hypothetical protein
VSSFTSLHWGRVLRALLAAAAHDTIEDVHNQPEQVPRIENKYRSESGHVS